MIRSIATIRPPAIVKPGHGHGGVPGRDEGAGAPVDDGRAREARERRAAREHLARDRLGAVDRRARVRPAAAGVDPEDHLGVQEGHQALEASLA